MIRSLFAFLVMALFGASKLPMETSLSKAHQEKRLRAVRLDLDLRDQIGQLGFLASLGGFRSLVADYLFVQAHIAWERTEWRRLVLLFQQMTTLQPRAVLFWETGAWHMAWNASTAAANNSKQPRLALRIKAQREYLELGKAFLERGIQNNPERPELYETLARLYRDKFHDHQRAAEFFEKAAQLPGGPTYARRFAAYELSRCHGKEWDAYQRLHLLYLLGDNQRAPTLIRLLKELEISLAIPWDQRIGSEEGAK